MPSGRPWKMDVAQLCGFGEKLVCAAVGIGVGGASLADAEAPNLRLKRPSSSYREYLIDHIYIYDIPEYCLRVRRKSVVSKSRYVSNGFVVLMSSTVVEFEV